MTHNDELIEELRNLRVRLAREVIELQTRREAYDEQKREVSDLRKAIEEVLEEIETGTTGRPILDAAQRLPGAPAPADPDDDDEPVGSADYDRDMTRAVEAAEARKAREARPEFTADDLAAIREQVEEVEGPAGDGTRTYICLRCRNGHGTELERCPRCLYGIRRLASGLIEDLEGSSRPKFVVPPSGGWTPESLEDAAHQLGVSAVGLTVCNRCDCAGAALIEECGGCRFNSFRRTYRKDGQLAVPPRPEPKAKKSRKGVVA